MATRQSEIDEINDLRGLFGQEVPEAPAEDPLFDVFKAFALFGKKGQTEAGKTRDGLDAWKPTAAGADGANPDRALPDHQKGVGLEGKQFMKLCKARSPPSTTPLHDTSLRRTMIFGCSAHQRVCCRWQECKLIDKKFTGTDVDLTFAKCKGVGEKNKHLWYDDFQKALEAMATKKGVAVDKVKDQIIAAGGPQSSGTKTKTDGIYGKMTDSSQYTGAHKERFDENGKGKGLDGRDRVAKGVGSAGTGATVNREETADARGVVKEKGDGKGAKGAKGKKKAKGSKPAAEAAAADGAASTEAAEGATEPEDAGAPDGAAADGTAAEGEATEGEAAAGEAAAEAAAPASAVQ